MRAEPRRAYRGMYTFNPDKGSGPLPRLLAQVGIAYEWFPELGNPERQDPEIRAFEQLMAQKQSAGSSACGPVCKRCAPVCSVPSKTRNAVTDALSPPT